MQRNYFALVLLASVCVPAQVHAMAGAMRRGAGQAAKAAGEYLAKESGALKQEAEALGKQAETLGKQAEVLAEEAAIAGRAARSAEGVSGRGAGIVGRTGILRGVGQPSAAVQEAVQTQRGLMQGMGGQTRGMATEARGGSKGLGDILGGTKMEKAKDKIATTTLKDVYALALKDDKSAFNKLLYELFGVTPGEKIDKKSLQELYYVVARKFHPDFNASELAAANEVMKNINGFYDMLLHGKSEKDMNKAPEQPMSSYNPDYYFAYYFTGDTITAVTSWEHGAWDDIPKTSTRRMTDEDRTEIKKASEVRAEKMPKIDKMTADLVERVSKIPGLDRLRWTNDSSELSKRYGNEWWFSKALNRKYKSDIGLVDVAEFAMRYADKDMFEGSELKRSLYDKTLYRDVKSRLDGRLSYLEKMNKFLDQFDAHQAQKAYNASVEAEILRGDDSF